VSAFKIFDLAAKGRLSHVPPVFERPLQEKVAGLSATATLDRE
jgi:hypothetical protein